LLDGSTTLGTQPLNASGAVTFSTSSLTVGTHALTATYAGDGSFSPSTSPVLNESVTDFQVTLAQASQTVAAGASATYALSLTPIAGFNSDVTITCSGLPSLAECKSASATVNANPTAANVVVTTTATTTAMNGVAARSVYACALGGLLFLFGIKGRRTFIGLAAMLLIFGSVGLSGCGGGGSQKTVPGTPAGSTTFTITATAIQNGVTVTHTSNATLVVQ
jgi:Bacterial Ig-like domain (group 3)